MSQTFLGFLDIVLAVVDGPSLWPGATSFGVVGLGLSLVTTVVNDRHGTVSFNFQLSRSRRSCVCFERTAAYKVLTIDWKVISMHSTSVGRWLAATIGAISRVSSSSFTSVGDFFRCEPCSGALDHYLSVYSTIAVTVAFSLANTTIHTERARWIVGMHE